MYILGFILIFAGLALMLLYFVLRFAGRQPAPQLHAVVPVVDGRTGATTEAASDSMPLMTSSGPVAAPSIPSPSSVPVLERDGRDGWEHRAMEETTMSRRFAVEPAPGVDLFATGYLYTDTSGKPALLQHPERVEAELTAAMKRLGPATLRFRREAFYFDHGDGLLVLPEKQMREVRFSDGGAVFVPTGSDLPLVFFFTVETQSIRDFLSSRS